MPGDPHPERVISDDHLPKRVISDDHLPERLQQFIEPFRVPAGSTVRLEKDFDPAFKRGVKNKRQGVELLAQGVSLLSEYQARLAAQDTWGVLVILQALDAGGKDGTIRHVMSGVNPQGVKVHSFKTPSAEELSHDYLWRHVTRLPARGEIGIFNRSHYEEVLVVRVHSSKYLGAERLPPVAKAKGIWKRRYREINDWERYLSDNGFKLVKLFLNISREEQRRRLLQRIEQPDRNWKFSDDDVHERRHWDDYQQAYSEMLSQTSTEWAPWYVIPADRKWFARVAVLRVLLDTLIAIDPQYPVVSERRRELLLEFKQELDRQGPKQGAVAPAPDGH